MGFFGLLAVLFIGLKLTNFITWSWWLVLLPLYGGIAIWLAFVIVIFIITLIAGTTSSRSWRWR